MAPDWRRTAAPVHAGSRHAHEFVATPVSRLERRQRIRLLRLMGRQLREPGKVRTALTFADEAIMAYLMDLGARFAGEVYPAAAAIARAVGCGVSTVHRAKRRLKALGWLDWIRRCEPTGELGRRGPQVRQISNAYALRLPARAVAILKAWGEARAARAWSDDEGAANARERARMAFADSRLGAAIDRLGAGLGTRIAARS